MIEFLRRKPMLIFLTCELTLIAIPICVEDVRYEQLGDIDFLLTYGYYNFSF